MTSLQRIVKAMRREPVDYLPCSIYFNRNLSVGNRDCANLADRIALSRELGVDPFIGLGMPLGNASMNAITVREIPATGGRPPVLEQTWKTPAGPLSMAIRKQGDCRHWDRIEWNDAVAGVVEQPLIKSAADIERLAYILQPGAGDRYAAWLAANRRKIDLAKTERLPLIATYGHGLATLLFSCGAEQAVWLAIDQPDVFEQATELIHLAELRNIEWAARAGIPILKRFGGYEQCNFYNPRIFNSVCAPRLKIEVETAHAHGLLIFYRIVTGMEPLLETIADLGFDCIEGGEPHLGKCPLERWRDAFAGKAASWTGISTPVLLGGKDPEAVRREVRHCVDVFGRTGFILGVTNSIRGHFPWENTLAMIDEWKSVRCL